MSQQSLKSSKEGVKMIIELLRNISWTPPMEDGIMGIERQLRSEECGSKISSQASTSYEPEPVAAAAYG